MKTTTKNETKLGNFQNIKDALLVAKGFWNVLSYEDMTGYAPVQINAAIESIDKKIKEVEVEMLEAMAVKQAKEFARNVQTVEIPLASVELAYSGRPGCMCGCNGNYHGGNTPTAARILKKVNAMITTADEVDFGGEYVYVRDFKRVYAVYFKKDSTKVPADAVLQALTDASN